jgi:adenosylmethionine-8-amino-7-oxononanoate aminotransferase
MSNNQEDHVLSYFMNRQVPTIARGEGVYLYDTEDRPIIDASAGAILCSLGHGVDEIIDAVTQQMKQVAYVFRRAFQTTRLGEAAAKMCRTTDGNMDRVFFVSGGSEATETAVKLARKYHIDRGNRDKFKVVSRWNSYHGATMGAAAWSGFTARRADFIPYLKDFVHLPPTYCYRCWYNTTPEACNVECAEALEKEILCLGPDTVSAYIAETVSGHALAGAHPPARHFERIREICDTYDVLMILDEVMCGAGRTGKWWAYQNFGFQPDIIAAGKGLGAGYYPIGATMVAEQVYDAIASASGVFGSGHTYAGNPVAAAVTCEIIDYLEKYKLVERAAEMGEYLAQGLSTLENHPTVGDIRGIGLLRGVEFVRDKESKEPLDPDLHFSLQVQDEALTHGMHLESSSGCDRGQAGDMVLFGPPFIITKKQIDEVVDKFDKTLSTVEKRL